jgi:hypothetical protein
MWGVFCHFFMTELYQHYVRMTELSLLNIRFQLGTLPFTFVELNRGNTSKRVITRKVDSIFLQHLCF